MTPAEVEVKFSRLNAERIARTADRVARGLCLDCGVAPGPRCATCVDDFNERARRSRIHAHGGLPGRRRIPS